MTETMPFRLLFDFGIRAAVRIHCTKPTSTTTNSNVAMSMRETYIVVILLLTGQALCGESLAVQREIQAFLATYVCLVALGSWDWRVETDLELCLFLFR